MNSINRPKANILIPTEDLGRWYRYCTMEGGIKGMKVVALRIKSDMSRVHSPFGVQREDYFAAYLG